jgi:hypothetical protein
MRQVWRVGFSVSTPPDPEVSSATVAKAGHEKEWGAIGRTAVAPSSLGGVERLKLRPDAAHS